MLEISRRRFLQGASAVALLAPLGVGIARTATPDYLTDPDQWYLTDQDHFFLDGRDGTIMDRGRVEALAAAMRETQEFMTARVEIMGARVFATGTIDFDFLEHLSEPSSAA